MMNEIDSQEVRFWGMLCHLSALSWIGCVMLTYFGVVFFITFVLFIHILGPLLIWLSKRSQHSFINAQGKESLNFQLSLTSYALVAGLVFLVATLITMGFILARTSGTSEISALWDILLVIYGWGLFLLVISQVVLVIFASVKAYKGQVYRYPFTIRYLK